MKIKTTYILLAILVSLPYLFVISFQPEDRKTKTFFKYVIDTEKRTNEILTFLSLLVFFCLFQDAEKTSSNSLFRCGEQVWVSAPVSITLPPIHMDNQTCLCSLNAQHPLCLIHCLFFHPPPPLPPPLTCSNTAGFFPDI